MKNLILKVAKC